MALTFVYHEGRSILKVVATWTSDSGGDASGTTDRAIVGTIRKLVTDPGTAAPTANYDITITDEEGLDVLALSHDDLADRHTSTTEQVVPLLLNSAGTPVSIAAYPTVSDLLTVTVANAGDTKDGELIMYVHREA